MRFRELGFRVESKAGGIAESPSPGLEALLRVAWKNKSLLEQYSRSEFEMANGVELKI